MSAGEKTPLTASAAPSGPVWWHTIAAMVTMITIATTKTQLTAFLFHYSNYPTAYSLYSCVVTCFMLLPFFVIRPDTWAVPTKPMAFTMGLIIFFTSLDLAGTNIALANLSTALQQCIAATNPFITILIETALYMKVQHPVTYIVVGMVVVGSILTALGEVTLDTMGLVFAIVAVCASASKYAFTHKAFRAFKGEMGAMALLFWVDLMLVPIFVVWTVSTGELLIFLPATFTDSAVFWQMTATAALGGVRALSQYVVLAFVTATSMSTANVFTQILNIMISLLFTQSDTTVVSAPLVTGIAIVIISSTSYSVIKANPGLLDQLDRALGCKRDEAAQESVPVLASAKPGWMSHFNASDAEAKKAALKEPLAGENKV